MTGTINRPENVEETLQQWIEEYSGTSVSVSELLCDRHEPTAVAFTFVEADLSSRDVTYGELSDQSRRLAAGLAARGFGEGDRIAVLLGKRVELVVTLLAIWRLGAVHVPLFTAFASQAIDLRLEGSRARLIVTDSEQREKLGDSPSIEVLEIGWDFDELIRANEPLQHSAKVGGDGGIIQLYTSGTTGKPKGVLVPAKALASFRSYIDFGLDVSHDDVYWNAADPGWAYGLYYGIVGPMVAGKRNVMVNAGFTPELTAEVIRKLGVTNFAGAPTMYRALSKSGLGNDLSLRHASSAGEPLTPDVVAWATKALGTEVRDHYGQTELGMVIGNSWHPDLALPLKDGSMGQAMPGVIATVIDGQIAISTSSPQLWFNGYFEAPEKSAERFTADQDWYLTADTGSRDDEGYFFFTARDDDVILAAGYRIGPFDVESVLITHSGVIDVAVVGRPDPEGIRGEVVEAFVVLADGVEASSDLERELQALVRDTYSKHAYPRTVHFVDNLPKTPSGKIQRFLLRQSN